MFLKKISFFIILLLILSCGSSKKIENKFFEMSIDNSDIVYDTISFESGYPLYSFRLQDEIEKYKEKEKSFISSVFLLKLTPKEINELIIKKKSIYDGINEQLNTIHKQINNKEYFREIYKDPKEYPYLNVEEVKYAKDTIINRFKCVGGSISYKYQSNLDKKIYIKKLEMYYLTENSRLWSLDLFYPNKNNFERNKEVFTTIISSIKFKKNQPEISEVTDRN